MHPIVSQLWGRYNVSESQAKNLPETISTTSLQKQLREAPSIDKKRNKGRMQLRFI